MEWIPFDRRTYGEPSTPPHPYDAARGRLAYSAVAPVRDPFPVGCGHLRCEQNYFEVRFYVGDHRILCFHGGLN